MSQELCSIYHLAKKYFLSEVINILRSYTAFSFQFEDLGGYTGCLHSQVYEFQFVTCIKHSQCMISSEI
jgi:hypothetical protein